MFERGKDKDRMAGILRAYFSGSLPADLERDILSWIMYEGDSGAKWDKLEELWDELVCYQAEPENKEKIIEGLAEVKERLGLPEVVLKPQAEIEPLRPHRNGKRITFRVAAVVIPLLVLAGWLLFDKKAGADAPERLLASAGDTQVEITLPDESRVWINKGSSVSYPEVFGDERVVEMEGEAYFAVRRDVDRPFVVKTERLSVNVLGTEFSVDAREDRTEVTLNEGRVRVDIDGESYLMNDRGRLEYDHELRTVSLGLPEGGVSGDWRKKVFEGERLTDVLDAVADRYNVTVEYDAGALAGESVTLTVAGDESLETILSRLSAVTGKFTYEVRGDKVSIHVL